MKSPSLHIRVFSDARPGHEIQSLSLAKALQQEALRHGVQEGHCSLQLHRFAIRQPWLSFCPRVLPRFGRNIGWPASPPEAAEPCDVVITCGRRAAAVGKWFKQQQRKTRQAPPCHVHILYPGDAPSRYDFLLLPEHDKPDLGGTHSNLLRFRGSLHPVNGLWLAEQRQRWSEHFQPLQQTGKTLAAFLIGNPGAAFFHRLPAIAQQLQNWQPEARWVVIASHRTPPDAKAQLGRVFTDAAVLWRDESDGPNPYTGALAYGDAFAVTADSINMLTEASATGKPLLPLATENLSAKHRRFLESLQSTTQSTTQAPSATDVSTRYKDTTAKTARDLWQAINQRQ